MANRNRSKALLKFPQQHSAKSTLLLSIRPKFVELILSGEKRVELRRQVPRVQGEVALIYESAPTMALVASFRIQSIAQLPLGLLWQSVRDIAGVSRAEFEAYFDGLDCGVAIQLADIKALKRPIPLANLREVWHGFQPPQSFRYLDISETNVLDIPKRQRWAS